MKMKNSDVRKFGFILLSVLLMSIQTAMSLGVTQPIPIDLKLLRGDAARFYFEIQAVMESSRQSCSYSISGLDPLVISFDKKEVVVNAGDIKNIYGTVSVPIDAPIKAYNGDLTVSCRPFVGEGVSGSVIHKTLVVPFTVNVVEKLEERVVREIPEEQKPAIHLLPMLAIIILVILVIYLVYWLNKKK
ncbi:MAG: hypothetical protein QMD36_05070 [Candidatus Aenigmarchaeota archaeon]|nr:hypothetical protein [Candidatus Aenigmarchaeota archaeon]